jgi:hypothetical protein
MRVPRHIVDLAGSGLVLIGFLLAAVAVSAVPVLVQGLTRHPASAGPTKASGGRGPGFSAPGRPIS